MDSEFSRTIEAETPLLVMTVDIGEGCKDNITIYIDSSIEKTVAEFSKKHDLTEDQSQTLISQLKSHLQIENCEPSQLSRIEYFEQWNNHIDKHLTKKPTHQPKINKNSIKMMQQRQLLPVHERLYSISQKKTLSPQPFPTNPVKGTQCGSRLYSNWLIKKQQTEKEHEKIIEEQAENLTKILTFQPQINKNIQISDNYLQPPSLIQQMRSQTLERKRFEKLAKEQENCTFTPQINPFSEGLLQNKFKLKPKSKFEELYEEATIRKEKIEELADL